MNLLLLVQGVIVLHSDGVVIALLLYTRSTCLSIISLTCRLMLPGSGEAFGEGSLGASDI